MPACGLIHPSAISGTWSSRSAYAQLDYSPLLLPAPCWAWPGLCPAPAGGAFAQGPSAGVRHARSGRLMAVMFPPTLRFYRLSPLWGTPAPDRAFLCRFHPGLRAGNIGRGQGGMWKGRIQADDGACAMTGAALVQSGKGHTDENFPVASLLIAARHRPAILAFYRFARFADDIADHPTAWPGGKAAPAGRAGATLAASTGWRGGGVTASRGARG